MTRLRVHLYASCWNEAAMLDAFFRHYDPWVDRYILFDDGSTDGTREILAAHPRVELRHFQRSVPDSFVLSSQALQDACWKESRGAADWVMFTDIDEHLYHPAGVPAYLARCHARGITLIPALGYEMVAEALPPPGTIFAETLRRGAPSVMMNKLGLFRPDCITATNFAPGRHSAAPEGRLVLPPRDELLLLHYKYLGTAYARPRQAVLGTRLGSIDTAHDWGWQYRQSAAEFAAALAGFQAAAVDIGAPGLRPWRSHHAPRWWRGPGAVALWAARLRHWLAACRHRLAPKA